MIKIKMNSNVGTIFHYQLKLSTFSYCNCVDNYFSVLKYYYLLIINCFSSIIKFKRQVLVVDFVPTNWVNGLSYNSVQ